MSSQLGFGVLSLAGLALLGVGALRRSRNLLALGGGWMLALGGAWIVGLPGAALGLIALGFLRRDRPDASAGQR